ncbi:MAG: hypothetical protein AAF483_25640, partial [Planctomycetota bacterium]
ALVGNERRLCEGRRMDGGLWPQGSKPKALKFQGSEGSIIGDHKIGPGATHVLLVEGGPDYLCACSVVEQSSKTINDPNWVALAFLGAQNSFHDKRGLNCNILKKLRNCRVRILADSDDAGMQAADKWAAELIAVGADVTVLYAGDLVDGAKDLNDAVKINPDVIQKLTTSDCLPSEIKPDVKPKAVLEVDDSGKLIPPIPAYYDSEKKEYFIQNPSEEWMCQTPSQMNRRLKLAGVSETADRQRVMQAIEDYYNVRYARPLAGRSEGIYEENGVRILVTDSPRFAPLAPGSYSNLWAVVQGLLTSDESDEIASFQLHAFLGWIQTAVNALRGEEQQDSQALAIAGPKDTGKSLVQHLITAMLGGRSAPGAAYMLGKTEFNADLFEAEHIILEDEFNSYAIANRLALGTAIKRFTVSTRSQSCHRKHRTAIKLQPAWWVTITLNDDPDSLQILPPFDDNIEDKIILLRASRFEMPMETHTTKLRKMFWKQLVSEIPAFLHWLIHDYQIPLQCGQDRRFVVKTWHHPELLQALSDLAPEARLLDLIDMALWDDPCQTTWTGRAIELQKLLMDHPDTGYQAKDLLQRRNTTGRYLGRIEKSRPERIRNSRKGDERLWTVFKPKN